MRLLHNMVDAFISNGQLRVYDVSGTLKEYGPGRDGPIVTLRLHDKALYRKLFLQPELAVAEAYMDGTLTLENGSGIYDLLNLFSVNRKPVGGGSFQRFLRRTSRALRLRHQNNDVESAKQNASSHYDLSTELYRLFLDKDLNYSCAYFKSPDDDLEVAQKAKLDHAISKLQLSP
ncbi:MAG: class I SAM-dependent methyltransferase, partial [Hyphomicrobiales bacterium]